jgi:hypothetical protein
MLLCVPDPGILSWLGGLRFHSRVLNVGCTVFRDDTVTGEQYPSCSVPKLACPGSGTVTCYYSVRPTVLTGTVPVVRMYSNSRLQYRPAALELQYQRPFREFGPLDPFLGRYRESLRHLQKHPSQLELPLASAGGAASRLELATIGQPKEREATIND